MPISTLRRQKTLIAEPFSLWRASILKSNEIFIDNLRGCGGIHIQARWFSLCVSSTNRTGGFT
jgi:hypothetical protein